MKKLKIILLLTLIALLFGCEPTPVTKPYIIIGKKGSIYSAPLNCAYTFTDKEKNEHYFCDTPEAYKIGDTIK